MSPAPLMPLWRRRDGRYTREPPGLYDVRARRSVQNLIEVAADPHMARRQMRMGRR